MSDPIVYGFPASTYVRTARMVLEEKGVSYTVEPVDFRSEAYRRVHPYGKIPAFRHGDVLLHESIAIATYIDEAFPGPALQPADATGRAMMLQWVSIINSYAYEALIRKYVMQYVFPKDGTPDAEAIEAAVPGVRHQLRLIDEGYGPRSFLVGDQLTLADLFLAPILYYVGNFPAGKEALAGCPGIQRGIAAVQARKSFHETVPPPMG